MEVQRYQWVGLLAGVPLFSGAWLSAFYNTPWWGVLGVLLMLGGLYMANHVERRSTLTEHATRGFLAGILAGAVARILGWLAAALTGGTNVVSSTVFQDTFRIVLAGNWWPTLVLILLSGVLGAAIASLEPEAKTVTTKRRK